MALVVSEPEAAIALLAEQGEPAAVIGRIEPHDVAPEVLIDPQPGWFK